MVTANEAQTHQQFSARNSSYSDRMALPQLDKNYSLPYFPLPKPSPEVSLAGLSASNLPGVTIGQQREFLNPLGSLCSKDTEHALSNGLGSTFGAPQKRFLIFDQSGKDTRLFFSPCFSPEYSFYAAKCNCTSKEVNDPFLMVEEKWDENHPSDGEDETLDDTEDINALLYSDSDYDDNNEVTSRRHSPSKIDEDKSCGDEQVVEGEGEGDDSSKRQRLLDGKYARSSLESGGEEDVESMCGHPSKREYKARIREALKILETIIPGLDNKDPVSIIDRAVAYLKAMKTEAEGLKLNTAG